MSRIPWTLYDNVLDETYIFPVNPYEDSGSHRLSRQLGYSVKAGLRKNDLDFCTIDNIVFERNIELAPFSYSGRVYTKTELDNLVLWGKKDYPLVLTDDLNRSHRIVISNLTFARVRSNKFPYKHTYNFSGLLLEAV